MSGPAALLAVLGALYLLECIVAVPGGLVAFRGTARASWRLVRGGFRVGSSGMRLLFVPALPWSRGVLLAGEHRGAASDDPVDGDERQRSRVLSYETDHVRSRLAELDAATAALRVDALAMFGVVFILSPLVVRVLGWDTSWPFLIAAIAALATFIVGDYRRAHADLSPGARGAPLGVLITLALSPASAMRAEDTLVRALLTGQHALVVAHVLCTPGEYERIAADAVRAWRRGATSDPAAEAFITATLGDPARLVLQPASTDPFALSYCPSCQAEYAIAEGACDGCGGIVLERYAHAPAP